MNRRSLLELLGLAAASATATATIPSGSAAPQRPTRRWPSLLGPIPLPSDGLTAKQQQHTYRRIALHDRLDVPAGYRSDVLLSWGDRLGSGAMGFNNDYLAFNALATDRALLTINFEYISAQTWCAGYAEAHGRTLPFAALQEALQTTGSRLEPNTAETNPALQAMAVAVAAAALEDLGVGVACLVRQSDGSWRHQSGPQERRIHGLSGLKEPGQQLRSSGPAAAVFRRTDRQGYDDGLGDRVIGTFANCAGGQTPWGTVLSAEENFQTQVVEAVYADGSSPLPSERPFQFSRKRIGGLGHLALQFLNKWGCEVTAFSSSESKADEARKLGAHHVVNSRDSEAIGKLAGTLDFILVTANVTLDWDAYIAALAPDGRLHFVGAVLEPVPVAPFSLIMGRKSVSGSPLGSPATVATMLEFCARHSIAPVTETFPMSEVNAALDHLRAGKARHRIVLKN